MTMENEQIVQLKEQLARVEAERDAMEAMVSMLEEKEWAEHASKGPVSSRLETCITTLMNELSEANERADEATVSGMAYAEERDEARAQLARSTRLYFSIRHIVIDTANSDASGKYHLIDDAFMDVSRFAHAEQQEAKPQFPLRNPRSAKFQAALEETFQKFESMSDEELAAVVAAHMPQQEGQGAQAGDETNIQAYQRGWDDRAATQPAAGEPVYQYLWNSDDWIETTKELCERQASLGIQTRTLWTAPPAAAHGDEAFVTVEQLQRWKDRFAQAQDFKFSTEVGKALAAMRAQGDGGKGDD